MTSRNILRSLTQRDIMCQIHNISVQRCQCIYSFEWSCMSCSTIMSLRQKYKGNPIWRSSAPLFVSSVPPYKSQYTSVAPSRLAHISLRYLDAYPESMLESGSLTHADEKNVGHFHDVNIQSILCCRYGGWEFRVAVSERRSSSILDPYSKMIGG